MKKLLLISVLACLCACDEYRGKIETVRIVKVDCDSKCQATCVTTVKFPDGTLAVREGRYGEVGEEFGAEQKWSAMLDRRSWR